MTSQVETPQPGAIRKTPAHILRRAHRFYRQHKKEILARHKAQRAENPQAFRQRDQEYSRKRNGGEYSRYQRERHQIRIPKVSRRELMLFRRDPDREERLGITRYVMCRECGAKLRRLVGGGHLRLVHKISREQYQAKWPGAPLLSLSLQRELSRSAKARTAALRGKPRRDLSSVRGHAGELPVSRWRIVCGLAEGRSYSEIGVEVNREGSTVQYAAHSMGQRGRPAVYDFGEPFTAAKLRALRDALGLSAPQLSKQVGIPPSVITYTVGGNGRLRPTVAKAVIAWRDALIRRLAATLSRPNLGEGKYSGSRILKTFFPNLGAKRGLLLSVLRAIRYQTAASPAKLSSADELGEWLCGDARLQLTEKLPQGVFGQFVLWAPSLAPSLWTHRDRIREHGDLWSLVDVVLAERWGTTPTVVSSVARARVAVIPPAEMRNLLIAILPPPQSQAITQSRKFGPDKTPAEKTVWFEIGRQVEEMMLGGRGVEEARRQVGKNKTCEYDTIVRYHRRYRTYKHNHPGQG